MPSIRLVASSLVLLTALITGCGTQRFAIKPSPLISPSDIRDGSLTLKVADKRENKETIGTLRGGFGNKLGDIVLASDLKTDMTELLTQALQKVGYSVVPSTSAVLEANVLMFVADSTGYGKFARHKIQIRLRDTKGEVRWERTFLGEAAGMQNGSRSVERAMNHAVDKLLNQAIEDFSSEFFSQTVKKINQGL